MATMYTLLSLSQSIKHQTANKMNTEDSSELELTSNHVSLVTGNTLHHEHVETGKGNHICVVIQVCIAFAVLWLCCDFTVLLYYSVKSKSPCCV